MHLLENSQSQNETATLETFMKALGIPEDARLDFIQVIVTSASEKALIELATNLHFGGIDIAAITCQNYNKRKKNELSTNLIQDKYIPEEDKSSRAWLDM